MLLTLILSFGTQGQGNLSSETNATEAVSRTRAFFHRKNRSTEIDSSGVKILVPECEKLFRDADDTLLLLMTPERIDEIRHSETSLEISYPEVKMGTSLGVTVYYTKLLIPLGGQFDGMIFYAGSAQPGAEKKGFQALQKYEVFNFVRNSKGTDRVKGILKNLGAKLN